MTGRSTSRALTVGLALLALEDRKAQGWDFGIHSSFCSDMPIFVARVRRPGVTGAGVSKVSDDLGELALWMEERTR